MFNLAILTCSDMGANGQREDSSAPEIEKVLMPIGFNLTHYEIVEDSLTVIMNKLIEWSDSKEVNLIVTTGGTGMGPRDVTPEATRNVLDRFTPGLDEVIRQNGMKATPFAALSRGVSGIRGNCLIINVPGSPKAARESINALLYILPHAMETLTEWKVEEHPQG